ncbi:MAG: C-GCAxxG-C-C family protein [Bacteroidales bacterium]|nr:C-GCAxxG-C-C family protein [Bacteroidales bacterium]MCF8405885.1 C-GCAxxG-C-C family protein [Bacteroidales bacterium]
MKTEKQKHAIQLFTKGKNCAQSVLISFADELKIDKQTADMLTSGLGAGMGRLHKTCGAVNASFMVIGMNNSNKIEDSQVIADKTNLQIQKLESDFAQKFGSSDCGPIINTDLKTEEGRKYFSDNNLKVNICNHCVEFCVEWLEGNLN